MRYLAGLIYIVIVTNVSCAIDKLIKDPIQIKGLALTKAEAIKQNSPAQIQQQNTQKPVEPAIPAAQNQPSAPVIPAAQNQPSEPVVTLDSSLNKQTPPKEPDATPQNTGAQTPKAAEDQTKVETPEEPSPGGSVAGGAGGAKSGAIGEEVRHKSFQIANYVMLVSGIRLVYTLIESHVSQIKEGTSLSTISYASTKTSTALITDPCAIATLSGIPGSYIRSASSACTNPNEKHTTIAGTTPVGTPVPVTFILSSQIPAGSVSATASI